MIAGELKKFPLGWCSTKGEDLFDFVRGVTFNKSESTDKPLPGFIGILRAGNLQDGIIIYDDLVYVPEKNVKEIQRINKFDLVVAMSSGSKKVVGKVSFVQKDTPEIAFGTFCGLLRPKNSDIGVWLKHFFQTNAYRYHISETAAGVNINNLKKEHFFALNIPFPPVNELRCITNKIEALQSKSKKAKQALEAAKPLLDKLRQSILASAFRGDMTADWRKKNPDVEPASVLLKRIRVERRKKWEENELAKMRANGKEPKDDKWKSKYKEPEPVDIEGLPDLPHGWCWVALEELGIHKSGVAYKSKEFVSEGIQVVKLGNLYQGRFDLLRDPSFLPEYHPDIEVGRIEPKDLLISQTGTRHKKDYGHFVIIPDSAPPLVLNQRVLCVKIVEIKLISWVLYSSRLNLYQKHFFSRETGGVNQGNVGIEGVMRGPIPIAPLPEMLRIASILESTEKKIQKIEKKINLNFEKLSYLNQSILSKAFQGDLVLQNPSDEPVSILLEKIKFEKLNSKSDKKNVGKQKTI